MKLKDITISYDEAHNLEKFFYMSPEEQAQIILKRPLTDYQTIKDIDSCLSIPLFSLLEEYCLSKYRLLEKSTSRLNEILQDYRSEDVNNKVLSLIYTSTFHSTLRDFYIKCELKEKFYKPLKNKLKQQEITESALQDLFYNLNLSKIKLSKSSVIEVEKILKTLENNIPEIKSEKRLKKIFKNYIGTNEDFIHIFNKRGSTIFEKIFIKELKFTLYSDSPVKRKEFMKVILKLNELFPYLFTILPEYLTEDDYDYIKKILDNLKRSTLDESLSSI
ncbi:hypothetical protein [Halobacteriovorax marinus]|uniref:hypothetical protein n=1 Tax=Halobacteriovorax marinus TaxID=97084 RepID=UPI003A93B0E7